MSPRLLPRSWRGAAAALLLLGPLCGGCTADRPASEPDGRSAAARSPAAVQAAPSTAAQLESLLLDEVPSGLPLVPDDELNPPAGAKTIDDLARYGDDSKRQRQVLEDYGYQRGWERFWRSGEATTSVFLDQFGADDGAAAYADDLARNDAAYYGGVLDSSPADLPAHCVLMARDEGAPRHGLAGPAAFAWCASGVFTVAVAVAGAGSAADARSELAAVTAEQLDRLPAG